MFTLGFGFTLCTTVLPINFFYRAATIAAGSATWGMRAMGIEFRRCDGTRLDLVRRCCTSPSTPFCMGVLVLQLISCATILGTRYRHGLPTSSSARP